MSLRLRLTLLYSSVLGGVLMIAGTLVYALVSVFLLNQVNNTLNRSAEEIISNLRINASIEILDLCINWTLHGFPYAD